MTGKELEIFKNSAKNIFYFAQFAWVVHPILGKVQFKLYPFQVRVLWEFLNQRFTIVLKSRQMGLTELIALYCLWLAMFTPYQNIILVSLKDRVAKRTLRRIKFIYKNLPEVLKIPIVNGRKNNYGSDSEMLFSNGSSIVSVPTTEDAARSEPVSLLVLDEAAIMNYAELIWASALPTLSTGGSAIVNSTPFGIGNFYYETWSEALLNDNGFKPIKIPWDLHPDRDINWYNKMRNALGMRRTAQEVDCDFLASGANVFDPSDIKSLEEELIDYPPIETRMGGNLLIFSRLQKDEICYIGADVSTGRAKDYSAFSVMNSKGEEKACFKGRVPVNKFRDILASMGKEYGDAEIAVDSIGVGEAVVSGLQELGYPKLYHTTQMVREYRGAPLVAKKVPGFFLNQNNRNIIINGLEQDIREAFVEIKNPFFISEAYTFIYDEMNRPVAMSKGEYIGDGGETYTDDAIIAQSIANFIRKKNRTSLELVIPK